MKIFEEFSTSTHFIFVVRPPVLFDLAIHKADFSADTKEGVVLAWHLLHQRMEVLGLAKNLKLKAFAKAMVLDAPELPSLALDEQEAASVSSHLSQSSDHLKQLLQTA